MERIRIDWNPKMQVFKPTKSLLVRAARLVVSSTRYKHSQTLEEIVEWAQTNVRIYRQGEYCKLGESLYKLVLIKDNSYTTEEDLTLALYDELSKTWLEEIVESGEPEDFI